ncbi:transcription repressor OFP15-like [Lycium ferocissimum]|uniref:transcription repressor OFP15-like n=1 Tax=Lycium ferocissimum TaxID=112874 RepID=UPI0028159913|nr:transcription repressor OFP15-like [Lycium ferocissimum]
MKLSSFFKNSSESSSSSASPWPWPLPTCGKPKTLSFRLEKNHHNIFNSTFHLDDNETTSYSLDEFYTEYETSFSTTTTTTTINGQDCIETMIKGLRLEKERLFFEPEKTSSILDYQESKSINTSTSTNVVDEGNINNISFVPMGLDSKDPFVDFRESMEEMVEANGIQDWESLQELLTCYLKVNCKSNHGYIVGAFVDLLVNLATFSGHENNINVVGASTMTTIDEEPCLLSSTTKSHSFTSPLSFCSSSSSSSTSSSITSTSACLSLLEEDVEEDEVIQKKKC